MPLILRSRRAYEKAKTDPTFQAELDDLWKHYVGRPSPLYFAERLTEQLGGAKIYFKRDELNHTGAHKINNVLGPDPAGAAHGQDADHRRDRRRPARRRDRDGLRAFGLQCVVFMGATDVERQKPNVFRMKLLGAEVVPVTSGRGTLKDAMNEALRDWVDQCRATRSTASARWRARTPIRRWCATSSRSSARRRARRCWRREGRLPDTLVACIGGGSNAMGLFHPFLDDPSVRMIGVEAGGHGVDDRMEHAASLNGGRPGVLHGNRTYLLQDEDGQIIEGAFDLGRARLSRHRPGARLAARHGPGGVRQRHRRRGARGVSALLQTEGIIPALEPAHALAHVAKIAPELPRDHLHGDEHVRPGRQGHLHRRRRARGGADDR